MSEQWTTVAAGGQRRAAAAASSAAKPGSRMTYVSPPARNGDRPAASAQQAAAAAAPKMRYVPPPTRNGVKPTAWTQAAAQPAAAGPAAAPKMRYVPPPARNGDHSKSPPPAGAAAAGARGGGSGKMKYVPPPKNAGEWVRPQKSSGGGRSQWDELARIEDERLKAGKKKDRAEAKQRNAVGMSGNDRADMLATQMEFDIWTKKDAVRTLAWARAEECRIPNKRVAKGGRLHKLINILLNNCDFVNEKLVQEKRYQDACRDPTLPNGLELKRQFVGPLAKKVLNKVVEEEAEAAFKADDPDSDDSEGMAM